ncbi:hypothetical protein D3C75_944460 [compost metagenome]
MPDSAHFQAGPVGVAMTDIQIDLMAAEVQRLVGARQVDLNLRMTVTKMVQARQQPEQAEARRGMKPQAIEAHRVAGALGGRSQALQYA